MFTIRIAQLNICIDNKFDYIEKLCRDYIVQDEDVDFEVSASESEIEQQHKLFSVKVSDGYSEGICLSKKVYDKILDFDALFLHASVVDVDGRSYAFSAPSGTGKSTHTNLWLKHFGDRARIVNGDKPVLRFFEDKIMAYGAPWCGKEYLHSVNSSKLSAICFIERSPTNSIRRANSDEVIERLFEQVLRPHEAERMDITLKLMDRLICMIPCYIFCCNISDEAVTVAYEAMKSGEGDKNNEA